MGKNIKGGGGLCRVEMEKRRARRQRQSVAKNAENLVLAKEKAV